MATSMIQVSQSAAFAKAYKKLHKNQMSDVDTAIEAIVLNPLIGEPKRWDLNGVYVHKFKSQHQEVLLAYEFDIKTRHLLLLGAHENFYRDLKR